MILVDINIPAVNETLDFSLDENTPVAHVLAEILGMVSKKYNSLDIGDADRICLYNMTAEKRINNSRTLSQQGVMSGSRLMLV